MSFNWLAGRTRWQVVLAASVGLLLVRCWHSSSLRSDGSAALLSDSRPSVHCDDSGCVLQYWQQTPGTGQLTQLSDRPAKLEGLDSYYSDPGAADSTEGEKDIARYFDRLESRAVREASEHRARETSQADHSLEGYFDQLDQKVKKQQLRDSQYEQAHHGSGQEFVTKLFDQEEKKLEAERTRRLAKSAPKSLASGSTPAKADAQSHASPPSNSVLKSQPMQLSLPRPREQDYNIRVPQGASAGRELVFDMPGHQKGYVTVPPGVKPGQVLTFSFPASPVAGATPNNAAAVPHKAVVGPLLARRHNLRAKVDASQNQLAQYFDREKKLIQAENRKQARSQIGLSAAAAAAQLDAYFNSPAAQHGLQADARISPPSAHSPAAATAHRPAFAAATAVERLAIRIPPGAKPGQSLEAPIPGPGHRTVVVSIPRGARPGQVLAVQVPASPVPTLALAPTVARVPPSHPASAPSASDRSSQQLLGYFDQEAARIEAENRWQRAKRPALTGAAAKAQANSFFDSLPLQSAEPDGRRRAGKQSYKRTIHDINTLLRRIQRTVAQHQRR